MNVYINGAFTSHSFYEEIRQYTKKIGYDALKICVYADWKDKAMIDWDRICEENILEQKQIQNATHESIHLALTNDLVEDMVTDYYGNNNIELFMIGTSDINFTNLAFKGKKYKKNIYILIPDKVEKKEPKDVDSNQEVRTKDTSRHDAIPDWTGKIALVPPRDPFNILHNPLDKVMLTTVRNTFKTYNHCSNVSKPIPLHMFLDKYNSQFKKQITSFELDMLRNHSIVRTYQCDGVFFIQYIENNLRSEFEIKF